MAFYMKPGQGPNMRTGNGLPSGLMGGPKVKPCGGPMMHKGDGKKHSEDEPIPANSKLEAKKDKKKMPKITKVKTDAPKKIMAVKTDAPKKPSKTGKKALTRYEQVQERYPGAELRKGTTNEWSWRGTTLIPSYKKTEELSDKEKIKKAINSKK